MAEERHKTDKINTDASLRTRHVFVRNLVLQAQVGVLEKEKLAPQRLIINVHLTVKEEDTHHEDKIENVVCYGEIVEKIKKIIGEGHINLVETIAEKIAEACLEDKRILVTRVRLEKPDIIPECESVGIEIERRQLA